MNPATIFPDTECGNLHAALRLPTFRGETLMAQD